jgi:hypothetical protein
VQHAVVAFQDADEVVVLADGSVGGRPRVVPQATNSVSKFRPPPLAGELVGGGSGKEFHARKCHGRRSGGRGGGDKPAVIDLCNSPDIVDLTMS